jgi:hypothetical protein
LFTRPTLIFLESLDLNDTRAAETDSIDNILRLPLRCRRRLGFWLSRRRLRLNCPLYTLDMFRSCDAAVAEGLSKIGQRLVQFDFFLVGEAAAEVRLNGFSI